jgi:hypothetical protein
MSGNGHHGTMYGPVFTSDRFGQPARACTYDGFNDYIDLGQFSNFTSSASFSISVWIQPDTVQLQTILMVMPDDFLDRFNAMAYYNHNGSSSTIWDFGNCTAGGRLMQAGTIFSSSCQHFVYTIHPNNGMKVYKDGVLNLSQLSSSSFVNRNRDLWIGGGWDAANAQFFFRGRIDDMRLYDRELTPAEVQQLYVMENYCTPTGLSQTQNPSGPVIVTQPGKLKIKTPSAGSFMLYDVQGNLLHKRTGLHSDDQFEINTSSWASQLVVYSFQQLGKMISGKLVVVN